MMSFRCHMFVISCVLYLNEIIIFKRNVFPLNIFTIYMWPHKWLNGSGLKAGRREVTDLVPQVELVDQAVWSFLYFFPKLVYIRENIPQRNSCLHSYVPSATIVLNPITFHNITWLVSQKKNTLIYFNTNYRTEMKLLPIIMDYSLLQFDALRFFLGVRLHGESLHNLFFQYKPPNISVES